MTQSEIEDEILSADIVKVVGKYVDLLPDGDRLRGWCPFHKGGNWKPGDMKISVNDPDSFYLPSPELVVKGDGFSCGVCGEYGAAASFIEAFHKVSTEKAAEILREIRLAA